MEATEYNNIRELISQEIGKVTSEMDKMKAEISDLFNQLIALGDEIHEISGELSRFDS